MNAEANVLSVPQRSADGGELSRLEISSEVLDVRVRPPLLKEAVRMYQANRRQGTHDTKTRGEVTGSTRKLWRQKGTGRARAGSIKNPVWRGGGIVFGPHPRDYSYSINRKQRRLALRSALFSKFVDAEVVVVDGIELEAPRTRSVVQMLAALEIEGRVLIATDAIDRNLVLSVRNLPNVVCRVVADLNAEEVLVAGTVILTRRAFDLIASGEAWASHGNGSATTSEASPAPEGEGEGAGAEESEV